MSSGIDIDTDIAIGFCRDAVVRGTDMTALGTGRKSDMDTELDIGLIWGFDTGIGIPQLL